MVFIQESKIAPKLPQYSTLSQINLKCAQLLIHVMVHYDFQTKPFITMEVVLDC